MTDNDIIKALEWWITVVSNVGSVTISKDDILAIYDLINRLQKDKEYYKNNRNEYQDKVMFISKQCDELQEENNRQKAENERLQNIIKDLIDKKETIVIDLSSVGEVVDVSNSSESRVISVGMLSVAARRARAEAITEFEDRLKAKAFLPLGTWCTERVVAENDIDQIAKELKGEQ